MNRAFALIGALLLATITVSSACMAAVDDGLRFTLESERNGDGGKIHANFSEHRRGNDGNDWSSGFTPSELIGLDISGFRSSGTRPLRFALIREAGRLDCAGNGGASYATGDCRFTADPAFTQLLVSRGIARPSPEQGLGLMALNVRRDLINAIGSARYPAPTINELMSLTAVGVDGRYISDLAHVGYRPRSIQSLVEFKALGVTPAWIGGFLRIGRSDFQQDGLVQLKAMDITPEYVAGFDRVGYRNLSVETLVQLKAMDITPEFVRSSVGRRSTMPPVQELVQLKLFGPRGRP